jgi:hypothetical protein
MTQVLVLEFSLMLKLMTPLGEEEVSEEEIAQTKAEISSSKEYENLREQIIKGMKIPGVITEVELGPVDVRVQKLS